ncbi:amino acid adenylation domain-containing protein [Streptomyces sp. NPDC046862]|uniref:amino acid adenylation domain-containing protein n=1 Tax=Streptomyces sp. NPDC046862 TaxID=3154603 RepID=UPI003453EF89
MSILTEDPGTLVVETSFAQQSLWLLEQVDPGQPTYNVLAAVKMTGPLDVAALHRALNAVVARHEALRTVFAFDGHEPVQVIHDELEIGLPVTDARPEDLEDLVQTEIEKPFDLAAGPLLRMRLLRTSDTEHTAVLVMHHIVTDGVSSAILFQELAICYEAFTAGRRPRLPELRLQYADYAVWQRETLRGEYLDEQLGYWKDQLAGVTPLLLPTDFARPAVPTAAGATFSYMLPDGHMARIEKMAKDWEVTPFMLVMAVWSVLLSRYTGRTDFTVATPVAGRDRSEVALLIGFFVNTLVLRADLSGDPTFGQLLGRIKETCLGGYAHADVPYEKLVEELQPARYTGNGGPLAQVMFSLMNVDQGEWRVGDLVFEAKAVATRTAKFDLSLDISPVNGGHLVSLEYSTELFEAGTVQRMAGHLNTLLDGVLADADRQISELPLMEADTAGAARADGPAEAVHRIIERQAAATPDAVAVICGERSLSYAQLDRRANRLAHVLRERGVRAETPVGVLLPRSPDLIVAFLAILKAGGAYVPADPAYPADRLRYIFSDAGVAHAVTTSVLAKALPQVEAVLVDGPLEGPDTAPEVEVGPEQLAYIVYTSGSSGRPKGAMNTHRGLAAFAAALARAFGVTPADRALQLAPLGFDVVAEEVYPYLTTGGSVALPDGEPPLETQDLWDLVAETGATTLSTTPSRLVGWGERERAAVPTSLGRLIFGSETAPTLRGLEAWRGWDGDLVQVYGVTEACCTSSVRVVDHGGDPDLIVPLGESIASADLYVLDSWLRPVPDGVPGELYIGGPAVGRGYVGKPGMTADRFVPDPFGAPGARLYRTGDMVRRPSSGGFQFLGRADAQVKIRGFRVEPAEVEAVLAEHPDLVGCAVAARPDPLGTLRLIGYVVPRGELDVTSVRAHLTARLPEWMVPALFVPVLELPLSANGKIDRDALPEPDAAVVQQEYLAPRTPAEEELADIWAGLLGLERVGVTAGFFDLGGNSLAAVRMVAEVRDRLGVELPLRSLFGNATTIASIAARITSGTLTTAADGIPRLPRTAGVQRFATSGTERIYWSYHEDDPEKDAFVLVGSMDLDGPFDVAAFERALAWMAHRHEPLRTRWVMEDGELVACVDPEPRPLTAPVVDVTEDEVAAATVAVFDEPFDLATDVLVRLRLLRLAPERHVLVLVMHHQIGDLRSLEVFCEELSIAYAAMATGDEPPLEPLPVQAVDVVAWQNDRLERDRERLEAYWTERLAGARTLRPPYDLDPPERLSLAGRTREKPIDVALVDRLRALAARERASLYMVSLTAFAVLLGAYSGQDDIVLMSPISLRERPETQGVLGVFINEPPIRVRLDGALTFRELLARVRDQVAADLDHRDLPVADIARLCPGLDLPVLFTEETNPDVPVEASLSGTLTKQVPYQRSQGRFAMRLTGGAGEAHLVQTYRTDLYSDGRVAAIADDYLDLLTAVAARPDARVGDPGGPCGVALRIPARSITEES